MIAMALREIKHYQSESMADKLIIPKRAFNRVVREVLTDALQASRGSGPFARDESLRIEADALVALQTMSEHIIVMVMEMWYVFAEFNANITSQKLAIHAKRTTVMPRDMHCLLDLWSTIDPTSPIGRESALTRATREREAQAGRRRLAKQLAAARDKAAAARAQGRSVDRRTAHFLNKR